MEGVAPAVSLFRPRASARPTIVLAENSGSARRSPGAGGRSRGVSRLSPEMSPGGASRRMSKLRKHGSREAEAAARSGITRVPNLGTAVSTKRAGMSKDTVINLDVSHHRAVAVVRLLRIEKGKAFVDLLNEKANDSGEKEIGYVERTLGFSTRYLDDRDIRLVKVISCTW